MRSRYLRLCSETDKVPALTFPCKQTLRPGHMTVGTRGECGGLRRVRGVVGLWRSPRAASSRLVETWTPSNHGVRCETLLQWLHGTHNMISRHNFSFGPLNPLSIRQGRRAWASRGRVAGGAGGHSGTRLALMPPPLRAPIFANEKRIRNTAVPSELC